MKKITILLIILLTGCATEKPTGKTEAEILFKEAKSLIADEHYILATEKLNRLKTQYPYSFYATPAELLQADILFNQENFTDAAAAYLLFRDFHPRHEKIDYVIYKIAESYYQQVPETFDRDLDSAVEAIKFYSEMLSKYPGSSYLKDAKSKINKCKKKIRNKEQYIADFYFKTEVYDAARWRYLDILENFSNEKVRVHSMKKIVHASLLLKEYWKCVEYGKSYSQYLNKSGRKIISGFVSECTKKNN